MPTYTCLLEKACFLIVQQEHNSNNLNNTFITHYYKYNQHKQRPKDKVLLKLVSHNHYVSIKIGLHKCELSSVRQWKGAENPSAVSSYSTSYNKQTLFQFK